MTGRKIFVVCPDRDIPCGGVKKLYRHVDILNKYGFDASIVHMKKNFRCSWFENNTRISSISDISDAPSDFLVLPESYERTFVKARKLLLSRKKRAKIKLIESDFSRIIFNQNCYYTFKKHSICTGDLRNLYLQKNTLAAIVVSEDSERYLKFAFPELKVFRIRHGIDSSIFCYDSNKKKQIAFMPRKGREDIVQVINILKLRGVLDGYDVVAIDNATERQTAEIMRRSLVFLSFGYPEGFSLPPAEAMACGCIVIGYHGMGGHEFFWPEFCFPVEVGDIIGFAKTVEDVLKAHRNKSGSLISKGMQASAYIRQNYSPDIEEQDVVDTWKAITSL